MDLLVGDLDRCRHRVLKWAAVERVDARGVLTVGGLHRDGGQGPQGIQHDPRGEDLSLRAAQTQAVADPQFLIHGPVEVEPERSTGHVGPDDHAIVLEEAPGRVVRRAGVATGEREVVVARRRRAKDRVLPVGPCAEGWDVRVERGLTDRGTSRVDHLCELRRVEQREGATHLFDPVVRAERHDTRTGPPPLGRDQHDAVGAARPIDGARRRVLENLDRLDVVRVQGGDRVQPAHSLAEQRIGRRVVEVGRYGHAVDDVERVVEGRDGVPASDAHHGARSRLATRGDDFDSGRAAQQRLINRRDRRGRDLVRFNGGHRARQLSSLGRAVADRDYLFELRRLGRHDEVDRDIPVRNHRHRLRRGPVADTRRLDRIRSRRHVRDTIAAVAR